MFQYSQFANDQAASSQTATKCRVICQETFGRCGRFRPTVTAAIVFCRQRMSVLPKFTPLLLPSRRAYRSCRVRVRRTGKGSEENAMQTIGSVDLASPCVVRACSSHPGADVTRRQPLRTSSRSCTACCFLHDPQVKRRIRSLAAVNTTTNSTIVTRNTPQTTCRLKRLLRGVNACWRQAFFNGRGNTPSFIQLNETPLLPGDYVTNAFPCDSCCMSSRSRINMGFIFPQMYSNSPSLQCLERQLHLLSGMS